MQLSTRIDSENDRHTRVTIWQDGANIGQVCIETSVKSDFLDCLLHYEGRLKRIRALEADCASLREQLAAARQYPPDMERPQPDPPSSQNDEARRWASYADYLERLWVAQNFKLGDAEADIRIALRDLDKCASSLNIDQSGPESISGRLSGFLWAVKQLLAEREKDSERLEWLEKKSAAGWEIDDWRIHSITKVQMWENDDKTPVSQGSDVRTAIDAARAAEDNADE